MDDVQMLIDEFIEGGHDRQPSGGRDIGRNTVTDIDGNVYETIQIGDQLWMAENLKVTHYNNGDDIQYVQSESSEPDVWENLSTGAYGYYNDDPSLLDTYGNLYNWYAVDDDREICPEGWHVPSDLEYQQLEIHLGMDPDEADDYGYRGTDEGSQLAGNEELWNSGDLENNEVFGTSGFNGLPAGSRYHHTGHYTSMGTYGYFWSSSEYGSNHAWYRLLHYHNSNVLRYNSNKRNGFSVRCLGEEPPEPPEEEPCSPIVWCCPDWDGDGIPDCDKPIWCCANDPECCGHWDGDDWIPDIIVGEFDPYDIWDDYPGTCPDGNIPQMCCEDFDETGMCDTYNPYDWTWTCDECPEGWIPVGWIPVPLYDCVDPRALNYNPIADGCEDGTNSCCEYPEEPPDIPPGGSISVMGCADPIATNYQPSFSCSTRPNDYSCCRYYKYGCADERALNYWEGAESCSGHIMYDYSCCIYRRM